MNIQIQLKSVLKNHQVISRIKIVIEDQVLFQKLVRQVATMHLILGSWVYHSFVRAYVWDGRLGL